MQVQVFEGTFGHLGTIGDCQTAQNGPILLICPKWHKPKKNKFGTTFFPNQAHRNVWPNQTDIVTESQTLIWLGIWVGEIFVSQILIKIPYSLPLYVLMDDLPFLILKAFNSINPAYYLYRSNFCGMLNTILSCNIKSFIVFTLITWNFFLFCFFVEWNHLYTRFCFKIAGLQSLKQDLNNLDIQN